MKQLAVGLHLKSCDCLRLRLLRKMPRREKSSAALESFYSKSSDRKIKIFHTDVQRNFYRFLFKEANVSANDRRSRSKVTALIDRFVFVLYGFTLLGSSVLDLRFLPAIDIAARTSFERDCFVRVWKILRLTINWRRIHGWIESRAFLAGKSELTTPHNWKATHGKLCSWKVKS